LQTLFYNEKDANCYRKLDVEIYASRIGICITYAMCLLMQIISYRYAVVESFATFWDRQVSQLIRGIATMAYYKCIYTLIFFFVIEKLNTICTITCLNINYAPHILECMLYWLLTKTLIKHFLPLLLPLPVI